MEGVGRDAIGAGTGDETLSTSGMTLTVTTGAVGVGLTGLEVNT